MIEPRYRIVGDNSGHDYVIPVDRSAEWTAWLDSQDWRDGITPIYAMRIEGTFTFADPRITY